MNLLKKRQHEDLYQSLIFEKILLKTDSGKPCMFVSKFSHQKTPLQQSLLFVMS